MAMFIRKEVEHQERLEAAGYRSQSGSGGTNKDQLSICGMAWMKRGGRNANAQSGHEKIGLCGAERDR
jgi:hypothetical protein